MTDLETLPFVICGTVVQGKHLGSSLGFPTANIAYDTDRRSWPREGVYVGVATLADDPREYLSILNQGHHPTTPEGVPSVEAHLLYYPAEPLYGRLLALTYVSFLRPETAFANLDGLKEQLKKDRRHAAEWAAVHRPDLLEKEADSQQQRS